MFFDAKARAAAAPLSREDQHDYQEMAINFGMDVKKCGLWMALGLGKSNVAGTIIFDTLANLEINRWLIVAPLRVSRVTWPETFAEWRHLAMLEYTVLSDDPETSKETKTQAVIRRSRTSKTSVDMVNMEMIPALVDYWRRDWPYDGVCIDESSKFKDHGSQRFKKLMLEFDNTKRLLELTATPASEGYESLFSQIALMDAGKRLGKFISHYRQDYFQQNRWTKKWDIIEKLRPEIDEKIADITLVMGPEFLPNKNDEPHFVEHILPMTEKFDGQYKTMEKDSVLEIGDAEIVADNAAAVWGKLLQMASGMVYETWKEPHPTREGKMVLKRRPHHLHDEKLDELEELVDQLDGKPLLLAYHWEESLERLKKRFPWATVLDKEGKYKKAWDAGKIKMLIAHPQSAAHGLNLQKPTNQMCFFDIHPSLENFLQFVGRLDRQGQKERVFVHLLLSKGTYDLRTWESLKKKQDGEQALLNRLRYLQRKVREAAMKKVDKAARSMSMTDEDDLL